MTIKIEPYDTAVEKHCILPIPFKAHKVSCLSAELIEDIFENHYGAAIRRLNQLERQHAELVPSINTPAQFSALKRKLLSAANSVTLHETYFNSIGDASESSLEFNPASQLGEFVIQSYGSVDEMCNEFSEQGKVQNQAADWLLLVWSERISQVVSILVSEQALTILGETPILALNLQQYAFEKDYGQDRDTYISAFLQCIHWGRVGEKFNALGQFRDPIALKSTSESITVNELKQSLEQPTNTPLVLDVRHTDDRERYRHRIGQTEWRDSFDVSGWADKLPKDKPIVVYCMYGFWVSQDVATELRAQGYDARSLIGGINSWRAMGYDASAI